MWKHTLLGATALLAAGLCESASAACISLPGINHCEVNSGQISLSPDGDLVVGHFGSSGPVDDGVQSIFAADAKQWSASFVGTPALTHARWEAINDNAPLPYTGVVSTITLTAAQNGRDIRATFISPNYVMRVYNGAQLIGTSRSTASGAVVGNIRPDPPSYVKINLDFLLFEAAFMAPAGEICRWEYGRNDNSTFPVRYVNAAGNLVTQTATRIVLRESASHVPYGGFNKMNTLGQTPNASADVVIFDEETLDY